MPTRQDQRPAFFEGQYLGAEDLTAALAYGHRQDARHLLGAHTWGIAMGLELDEAPVSTGSSEIGSVAVQPGYAWDGFGRPIVVLARAPLSPSLFQQFEYDASQDEPDGRLVEVLLRYQERTAAPPRPGFEPCDGDAFTRVQETFRLLVRPFRAAADPGADRDAITVDGRATAAEGAVQALSPQTPPVEIADASIPYQAFPETGRRDHWLIPIGVVRWKPNPNANLSGGFVERTPDDLRIDRRRRHYVGVVAESLNAADGLLRLRDRTRPYSQVWLDGAAADPELVWVEGDLRVEGDARLFGGELELRSTNGLRGPGDDTPLRMTRQEIAGGGSSLRLVIGAGTSGHSRLAVGPEPGGTFEEQLTVRDDGRVGLGTTSPAEQLHLAGDDPDLALDIRSSSPNDLAELRFKLDGTIRSKVYWSKQDGKTYLENQASTSMVLDQGNVGIATANPLNALHVARAGHLNAILDRTDTSDHLTLMVGSNGSGLCFSNSNAFLIGSRPYGQRNANTVGAEHLRITAAGNVGIGTATPLRRLHVEGDRIRLEQGGKTLDMRADGGSVDLHSATSNLYLQSSGPAGSNNVFINPHAANGNVGIGTTSPGEKLDVRGHIRLHPDGSHFATGGLENLRMLRGSVRHTGSIRAGSGFSVSREQLGIYMVTFDRPFSGVPTVVATQQFPTNDSFASDGGNTRDNCVVIAVSATRVKLKCGDGNGAASNRRFEFIAVGPR